MLCYTQKDIDTIRDFYENNYKLMISIAYGILRNRDDAEEVVHDVFLKLVDNYNDYKDRSGKEFRSLALIITKHTCINLVNKKRRQKEVLVEIEDIIGFRESVQDEYFKKYREQEVRAAIAKLKEQDRCILILRYYHNMNYSQISEALSINRKNVEMRLRRARGRMKVILEKDGVI